MESLMISFYLAYKIMNGFENNQWMIFVRNYVIASNNLAYNWKRFSKPIFSVFFIEQCSTTYLYLMLRLGKIENLYHIAKFSFGLFFVFLKRIRLRSKLISIWFNSILNEITELKITYIITLNMHINLPREAYTRIRGRNRLVAYELFYSPTTDPILPHIS